MQSFSFRLHLPGTHATDEAKDRQESALQSVIEACTPDDGYLIAQLFKKLLFFQGGLGHVSIPLPKLGLHLQA